MNGSSFFYTFSQEDRQANILLSKKFIDHEGRVLAPLQDEDLFNLSSEDVGILRREFQDRKDIYCRFGLVVDTLSSSDIVKITQAAAHSLNISKSQIILRGFALLQLLKKRIVRIYESWSGQSITPLFKVYLEAKMKDVDWLFLAPQNTNPSSIKQLVNQGLQTHLSASLKEKKIYPAILAVNLALAHNSAIRSYPGSYPATIAKEQGPLIRTSDPALHEKYVQLCGFLKAKDHQHSQQPEAYSVRVLGRGQYPQYDITFTNIAPVTATPINSLYVNLSSLFSDKSRGKIRIESTLGPDKRFQAICDRVLCNQTFEPNRPATHTDFARLISHFTLGGRSYNAGGLDKSIQELKQEAHKLGVSWAQLLGSQLISRVKYHHDSKSAVLVALAFNASAILMWKNPHNQEEIQRLWGVVLGKVTNMESYFPHTESSPLIEQITMNMLNPKFLFAELYSQLQISFAIEQNGLSMKECDYKSIPTQTDGHIFHHVLIQVQGPADTVNFFYLFFPYDLPRALGHLYNLHSRRSSASSLNLLQHLHHAIVPRNDFILKFGESPLSKYFLDPRRQSFDCFNKSKTLMNIDDERAWRIGFSVACSLLSQSKEDIFLKNIVMDLTRMLTARWPSLAFKKEMAAILSRAFVKSSICFKEDFFEKLIQLESPNAERPSLTYEQVVHIATGFLKTDTTPLIEAVLDILNTTKEKHSEPTHIALYQQILKVCLAKASAPNEIAFQSLTSMINYLMGLLNIPAGTKISVLTSLYQIDKIRDESSAEILIFNAFLSNLALLPDPLPGNSFNIVEVRKTASLMLQSSNRRSSSDSAPIFFRELSRLQLIDSIKILWQSLLELTPHSDEQNIYNYLLNILSTAKEFGLWSTLTSLQKSAFLDRYTKSCLALMHKTGKEDLMLTQQKMVEEESHHHIHKILLNSLEETFKQWKPTPNNDEGKISQVIDQLKWVNCNWEERSLVANIIDTLSQKTLTPSHSTTLYLFMDKFQRASEIQYPVDLILFWFEQLSNLEKKTVAASTVISKKLLELILEGITRSVSIPKLTNDLYSRFFTYVIPSSTVLRLIKEALSKHSDFLLIELERRGMAKEILCLGSTPGVINYSDANLNILINNCKEWLHHENERGIAEIEPVFRNMAEHVHNGPNAFVDPMFHFLAEVAFKQLDYIKASQWIKQSQVKGREPEKPLVSLAFQIYDKLLLTGQTGEACSLILSLPNSKGFDKEWLIACKSLIEAKDAGTCLQLLEQEGSPLVSAIKNEEFSLKWQKILKRIKKTLVDLSAAAGSKQGIELQKWCILMEQMMQLLNPNHYLLWMDLIELVSKHGSLTQTENLCRSLLIGKTASQRLPTTKMRMTFCWVPLFERIKAEGSKSTIFLEILGSNKNVAGTDKEIFEIPDTTKYLVADGEKAKELKEVNQAALFYSHLVGGFLQVLKTKDENEQKTLADRFLKTVPNESLCFLPILNNDHQAILDVTEIYLIANTDEYLDKALLRSMYILMTMNDNPVAEAAAVHNVNRGVRMALKSDDIKVKKTASMLINVVTKSEYCKEGDHFLYLELLHQTENKSVIENILLRDQNSFLDVKSSDVWFDEKACSLLNILQNPYSKRKNYSLKEKNLVNATLEQLMCMHTVYHNEITACLAAKNIEKFTTPEMRSQISNAKLRAHPNLIALAKFMKAIQVETTAKNVRTLLRENLPNVRYKEKSSEIEARQIIRTNLKEAYKTIATVAFIALAFISFFWIAANSNKMNNKDQ